MARRGPGISVSQEFSFSRTSGRDPPASSECDSPPLRRMQDEERENFHFSCGVHVNSNYQGARGDPRYGPVRKPAVVRKGAAWEGVNIDPGQEQHRTPKVTCKFC
eukprot:4989299-Pleurochrysis_carterae.AAC.1